MLNIIAIRTVLLLLFNRSKLLNWFLVLLYFVLEPRLPTVPQL